MQVSRHSVSVISVTLIGFVCSFMALVFRDLVGIYQVLRSFVVVRFWLSREKADEGFLASLLNYLHLALHGNNLIATYELFPFVGTCCHSIAAIKVNTTIATKHQKKIVFDASTWSGRLP